MNEITVHPAAIERWPDIETLFARTACWCQAWRVSATEYGRVTRDQLAEAAARRRAALLEQVSGPTPPGMLAYLDGEVCGWCGIGPRAGMERLVRSRTIPRVDDRPVWSIVCFLVRPRYRRRGVARALLRGVVDYARSRGIPALEAYPVDPGDRRIDTTFAYVGLLPMFEQAGFHRVTQTAARSAGLPRWVVRLDLRKEDGP